MFSSRRRSAPARPAEVIAAEKAEKLRLSKTCQICNRPIFAETGVIAHHGYERPYEGYQTSSCPGARRLPFEVTCKDLQDHIVQQRTHLMVLMTAASELEGDLIPARFTYTYREGVGYNAVKRIKTLEITPANFDAVKAENSNLFLQHSLYSYASAKARDLSDRYRTIKQIEAYCVEQEARAAAWTQTFKRENGEWVAL